MKPETVMRYRKKPVVVEAFQLLNKHITEMPDCSHTKHPQGYVFRIFIPTLEGNMFANEGDWIIKGVKGEIYPCKPDIFEATYEPVTENMEQST